MMTRLNYLLTAAVLVAGAMFTARTAHADIVVLNDDFNTSPANLGTATESGAVNGGFTTYTNGAGTGGSAGESGSNASITTGTGSNQNRGIVSNGSFNAASSGATVVEWKVTSFDDPASNGMNLTLQSDGGVWYANSGNTYFSIAFDKGGTGQVIFSHNIGTAINYVATTNSFMLAEALDGFTLTATFDATGVSITTVGMPSFGTSGNLSVSWATIGGGSYNGLFGDGSTYVGGFIQTGGSTDPTPRNLSIDRITVTLIPTPAALPAGLALLGLAAMRHRK